MEKRCDRFGIKLGNLPILAIRREFNDYHWLIAKPEFRERLRGPGPIAAPIETPSFVWRGPVSGLLTLILQRAFTGVEAYFVGAAYWTAGRTFGLTKELVESLMDPFGKLKGSGGVPDKYYNRVPALASKGYALERADKALWEDTVIAYREVRNPLFHGYQVDDDYATGVLAVCDFIADLYRWIDRWCNLDEMIPGAAAALTPKPRGAA